MNRETFVKKIPMRLARTECRFDLRVYVAPGGHGFLFALDGTGKTIDRGRRMVKIPYSDRKAAMSTLDEILDRAQQFAYPQSRQQVTAGFK